MNDNSKKVLQGLLIGAAAGVVAGLLLAPSAGKETRQKIAGSAKDLTDKFSGEFENAISKLTDLTESTLSSLKNTGKGDKVSNN